ncbi:MFS transporter [bacterium]|nr:MFS transporter [bacterium]
MRRASPDSNRHDPWAALRQRNFTVLSVSTFCSGTTLTLVQAAIAWQVYQVSDSVLQLGVVGLVRFLPSLGLSLVGGALADSHDRRLITLVSQAVPLFASIVLMLTTLHGNIGLPLIYGMVFVLAVASSFENPARRALLVSCVTPEAFTNGITVNSTLQKFGQVTGPAVAGLAIAAIGISGAYALNAAIVGLSLAMLVILRPRPREGARGVVSVAAIREGIVFVWRHQVLLGAMTLDMFAVIFGGATALLPVFAKDILGVGALGYGLLSAAIDIGALAMSVVLVFLPQIRRAGRALIISIAVFGLGTIAFGLSRSFLLSMFIYMAVGAADQISVVMRSTLVQLESPDELRGRVASVNGLFIGASNQMGAAESGVLAAITSATFAVVFGGAACLGVLGLVTAGMGKLRSYEIPEPAVSIVEKGEEVAAAG